MDIIDRYISLFRGRGDCYGSWEGGCIKEPLTRRQFEQHLTSGPHIGVYPLITDHVSWGCIDIDGKDFDHDWHAMFDLATNLRTVLAVKHIHAHIERTRNGYHLWVFPTRPVPAATMRRALMAACKAVGYDPKEVNPKQETLEDGKLGNYVRLPYYGALTLGPRERMADRYFVQPSPEATVDAYKLTLEEFLATVQHTHPADLEKVAALWRPPTPAKITGPTPKHVEAITTNLGGLTHTIWRDGPFESKDRSGTLMKLAHLLRREGLSLSAAFVVVKDADARWGKFHGRDDCDEQITKIVERAYAA